MSNDLRQTSNNFIDFKWQFVFVRQTKKKNHKQQSEINYNSHMIRSHQKVN